MTASGIEQGGTGELWPNPHSGVARMRVRMRMKLKHLLGAGEVSLSSCGFEGQRRETATDLPG